MDFCEFFNGLGIAFDPCPMREKLTAAWDELEKNLAVPDNSTLPRPKGLPYNEVEKLVLNFQSTEKVSSGAREWLITFLAVADKNYVTFAVFATLLKRIFRLNLDRSELHAAWDKLAKKLCTSLQLQDAQPAPSLDNNEPEETKIHTENRVVDVRQLPTTNSSPSQLMNSALDILENALQNNPEDLEKAYARLDSIKQKQQAESMRTAILESVPPTELSFTSQGKFTPSSVPSSSISSSSTDKPRGGTLKHL